MCLCKGPANSHDLQNTGIDHRVQQLGISLVRQAVRTMGKPRHLDGGVDDLVVELQLRRAPVVAHNGQTAGRTCTTCILRTSITLSKNCNCGITMDGKTMEMSLCATTGMMTTTFSPSDCSSGPYRPSCRPTIQRHAAPAEMKNCVKNEKNGKKKLKETENGRNPSPKSDCQSG